MKTNVHPIHDRFFKRSLKEKKIAISFLKSYLPTAIYQCIDINTLQLTEKSFVAPELREIHSDIIYKCHINEKSGYLFFLIEHESTAKDELMAFRLLHYAVSLSYDHLLQGNKKLPIILPLCIYHGVESPYPHSCDLYDCFENPEFARKVAFKPFKLIDLTVLSDQEIELHGLAALMEMLFKHSRAKNFLTIFKQKLEFVQGILDQLDKEYRRSVVKYVIEATQDEEQSNATDQLIHTLITAFPEETNTIMTFAQQLEQKGLQKGREEGRREEALFIARKLLAEGMSYQSVQKLTGVPEKEIMDIITK